MDSERFDSSQQTYASARSRGQKNLIKYTDGRAITRNQVHTPGYGNSMTSVEYMGSVGRRDPTKREMVKGKRLRFISAGDEF